MEKIIEQCVNDGACAGQAALVGRDGQIWDEVVAHMEDWAAGFNPEPTVDMVAAWMVGFSGVLARHFELLQKG
ncbi:hypothetical protein Q5O_09790 [Pseudomonas putida JB]|uniref:hypothetical protein n=1 Tax=Pseudomonas putida TaxID=303 RepID=UPI00087818C6|nr:hypothetical protein [Pseudomonas putida]AOX08668.1 hypothetical protein Q5O_09790 [Pseudomonas putida JB]